MRKTLYFALVVGIFVLFVVYPSFVFAQPYISEPNPAVNETQVPVDTNITFHLKDAVADITLTSIKVTIQREGDTSAATVIDGGVGVVTGAALDTSNVRDIVVSYDPPDEDAYRFAYKQVITVAVEASDAGSHTLDGGYSFTTVAIIQAPNVQVNHATGVDQLNSRMVMDHSGKDVYVVWQDENNDIWFSGSPDRGETFSAKVKLNAADSGVNENPAIAVDEPGNIYVIWQSKKDLETSDLFFCRRLKGEAFEVAQKIPVDTVRGVNSDQMYPAIQANNSKWVVITWVNRNGDDGVYYSRLEKNDSTSFWTNPVIYRVDDSSETYPQYSDIGISSSGNDVIFTWSAEKGGMRNIYFNAFTYVAKDKVDSKVYATDIKVNDATDPNSMCDKPRIGNRNNFSSWGSKAGITIVWESTLNPDVDVFLDTDICMDKSTNGLTWGTDIRVNADDAADPVLQQSPQVAMDSNGDMFFAWADKSSGNWDIYSTYSLDQGATFKDAIKFNDNSGSSDQYSPSLYLSANGKNICICWTDKRNADADIYFGRNTITDGETCANVDKNAGGTVKDEADTQVTIPALALETDTSISVARVYCPPGFIFGKADLNKFVHFGPSGTKFKKNVTITIPYTLAELSAAGLASDSPLTVYYYNPKTKAWEAVTGTTQDSLSQLVMASVDHFSTYALAEGETGVNASGGGGGSGGCFIATAAFGSYESKEVKILRLFRDKYLISRVWGREFVKFYYAHSPALAGYIHDKPALKSVVRLVLKPVVGFVSGLKLGK